MDREIAGKLCALQYYLFGRSPLHNKLDTLYFLHLSPIVVGSSDSSRGVALINWDFSLAWLLDEVTDSFWLHLGDRTGEKKLFVLTKPDGTLQVNILEKKNNFANRPTLVMVKLMRLSIIIARHLTDHTACKLCMVYSGRNTLHMVRFGSSAIS